MNFELIINYKRDFHNIKNTFLKLIINYLCILHTFTKIYHVKNYIPKLYESLAGGTGPDATLEPDLCGLGSRNR